MAKVAMVTTFTELANQCNTPVEDAGGHACRITGARHMASIAIDIWLIQLLARWSSEVVMRYVREAPLARVTDTYKRRMAHHSLDRVLESLRGQITGLESQLSRIDARTSAQLHQHSELQSEEPRVVDRSSPPHMVTAKYVVNPASGKVHLPTRWSTSIDRALWKTKCGWAFGSTDFVPDDELPLAHVSICDMCLPKERRLRKRLMEKELTEAFEPSEPGSASPSASPEKESYDGPEWYIDLP